MGSNPTVSARTEAALFLGAVSVLVENERDSNPRGSRENEPKAKFERSHRLRGPTVGERALENKLPRF